MIIYQGSDLLNYLEEKLNIFSTNNVRVIIIDKFYDLNQRTKKIIEYIRELLDLNNPIIWFYEVDRVNSSLEYFDAFDLKNYDLNFHDRFIFLYDLDLESYVLNLHIGASLNGVKFHLEADEFDIFRISVIDADYENLDSIQNQLENIYLKETKKEKWDY
ncbi:hypothetical protein SAMN04488598_10762 [Halanaerobium congolense]|uniref:Uncharacterized protein n=1 Tax=Halanaerobium congolense TaxID=54121 RepID=A0A1H9ZSV5_9FIRM|nr:hypothetical protein [Halanaerobium congolense]PTX16385.1 hypothetical protein C7953_1102 [Halanaerobium congolense]SDF17387.1 hypothetical protein SAMN04488598_10762 [Halanaerobium congolense]SES84785.1 hypothetical protein SAMN04515652_10862 [Halanaerobium congolense]SFO95171.1 hypothetical protein SAMN04488596_10358 [Halanaerobium congolense]